jgi:two-component system, chemotaxis family, sensor kinase CheA
MWRLVFGKYREIVAAIGVFIILDAGVLLLNFYTTYQISDDAHAIHLANRQSMLSQRIFYSIERMRDDLQNGRDFEVSKHKLAVSYKQFDEVLDAFIYGGTLIGEGQGQDQLLVDDSYQLLSEQYLTSAEILWKPFRALVGPLVYAEYYDEDFDEQELQTKANLAVSYAFNIDDELLLAVTNFSLAVEAKAHKKAANLRMVQAIAIGLAIINFFIIVFHFIQRLNFSDTLAERAQSETAEIMRTVNDGLFLLDQHYKIGSQYSAKMQYLFRQEAFSGIDFFDLLDNLVSSETMTIAKDYIDSLFNDRVKSSLMDELNPLKEVEISLSNKHGVSNHYFTFSFSRVYHKNTIVHLLVSVTDTTELVELRKKLEGANGRSNQEAESFLFLMNVDSELLKEFIVLLDNGLHSINEELERPEYSSVDFSVKRHKINRIAHSLKGEASMLGLSMVETGIHVLEDKLAMLNKKERLEGDDFLPITIALNALLKTSESIKLFSSRFSYSANKIPLKSFGGGMEKSFQLSPLHTALLGLAKRVSTDVDKKVRLDVSRFDTSLIPSSLMSVMKTVLIQLIRNAIVHGLEKPKKRVELGKPKTGLIEVIAELLDDDVTVTVRDDGRGIDFNAVKQYLLIQGQHSVDQVKRMGPRELVRFIFQPGFSTSKHLDNHSGRGVGLDVVKASIDGMGAYLSVSCKSKRSSEFRIRIPVTETLAAIA